MTKALKAFSQTVERWWPALLWMLLILIASLDWASGGTTFELLLPILRWIHPDIPMHQVYDANLFFRKACHFLEFLILALLIWRTRGSWKFVSPKADLRFAGFVFLISIGLAVGSEYIQSFFKSRTANATDVFINLSGATAGILIAIGIELTKRPRGTRKPKKAIDLKPRILFTANLLLHEQGRRQAVLARLRRNLLKTKAQMLVVAGNIAHPMQSLESLRALKAAAEGVPVAICLGVQDHWLPRELWSHFPSPEAVRHHFWEPALAQTGIVGLDFQNFALGNVEIVGAYGHFDLGFRNEKLVIDGEEVKREAYLAGTVGGFQANDMRQIPQAGETLEEEAKKQADGLEKRLGAVPAEKEIVLVTGTVPFEEWLERKEGNTIGGFFRAYAGNSLLAEVILPHAKRIRIAAFGGKENGEDLQKVHGISGSCLNPGKGRTEYVIFDTERDTIERL